MKPICTLIDAKWIIPVEPVGKIYTEHSLAISNSKIIDILPTIEASKKYQPQNKIELGDHALIPGLINCHTHIAMSLLKGFADDLPLVEWLNNHIWPAEGEHVSHEFVADGSEIAIAEMLKSGTTTFNDMYFFPEATAQIANSIGIRACIGLIALEFPSAYAQNADEYIAKGLKLFDKYKSNPLISMMFSPHAPYTVSPVTLKRIKTLADELELNIQMHIHETAFETEQSVKENGARPIANLDEIGFISSELIAVHMTQLSDDEINLLAEKNVSVAHCPESNLKLASGFCPITKLIDNNVNVCLGTDGSASNNDLDMFGEMKTAALLAKGVSGKADSVPAETALQIATINGAKALGIANETGSLEIGKQADITAINLGGIESLPIYDPVSQIVYASTRDQVTDVWVAGKQLLSNRVLTTIDEPELINKAKKWQAVLTPKAE